MTKETKSKSGRGLPGIKCHDSWETSRTLVMLKRKTQGRKWSELWTQREAGRDQAEVLQGWLGSLGFALSRQAAARAVTRPELQRHRAGTWREGAQIIRQ